MKVNNPVGDVGVSPAKKIWDAGVSPAKENNAIFAKTTATEKVASHENHKTNRGQDAHALEEKKIEIQNDCSAPLNS